MKKFSQKHLSIAISVVCFSQTAFGENIPVNMKEPYVVLAPETFNFEDYNRYTVPNSTASAGLNLSNTETPQMVSMLNQARIKDQNLQTMKDVLDNTTGINVSNRDGGRLSFSSRGFNIEQFSADGADMGFNAQMSVGETLVGTDIYDRIEVTHGATGLLTGSGEPSARVNMIRKKAIYDTPTGEISANANRFGNYGASLDYGQALTKSGNVRGRMVLNHQDGETFIDGEERGRTSYYATVQADLTDKTTFDIGAVYRKNKQHGIMWGALPAYFSDGSKTNWESSKNNSVDWTRWDNETKEYFGSLQHHFNDDWELNLKAYHMDAKGNPKLLYHSYNTVDKTTGLPSNVKDPAWTYNSYIAKNATKQTFYSADIKGWFDLFGKEHQLTFGASHHTDKRDAHSVSLGSDPNALTSLYDWHGGSYPEPIWPTLPDTPQAEVKTTEKSIYGATQLKIAEPLTLVLGSRLSDYDKTGFQWGKTVTAKADHVWTPYAGIIYDINDSQSVYASYTSIFKPQSVRGINGDYLDAEEGNTYELGFKSGSLDGKLQGQVTLFHVQKDNMAQAMVGDCNAGRSCVQGTENSTKEVAYTTTDGNTSTGIEVEVSGELSPNWQAMMSFSQFNAKDRNGKAINTTSSDRMIKLWTIHDMSRYINGLSIGGGVNWYGERYAYLTNPATNTQEKYGQDSIFLVNLMGRYRANPNLDFQLNINNVLNEKYLSGTGFNQITNGEPLNVSGSITYRF